MKTKKMTKTIIGVLAGVLLLSLSATAQAVLTVTQIPSPLPQNWGEVKFTNFGNATSSNDIYLGVPNFDGSIGYVSGDAGNWKKSGTTVTFAYIPTQPLELPGKLQATIGTNAFAFSIDYSPKPEFDTLQVSLTASQYSGARNKTQVSLRNLMLYDAQGGLLIGQIAGNATFAVDGSTGGAVTKYWTVTGYDFSTPFFIQGTIASNKIISTDLISNVKLSIVPNVKLSIVPIPAAVWLLGSGLIGLAVLRRRTKT